MSRDPFLLRNVILLAVVMCPTVCLSVRLSVRHTPVLYQNGQT